MHRTLVNYINLLQAVEDKYAKEGAKLGLAFDVQFKKEHITLVIPGNEIEVDGWKIICYYYPVKVSLLLCYHSRVKPSTFLIFSTDHRTGHMFR